MPTTSDYGHAASLLDEPTDTSEPPNFEDPVESSPLDWASARVLISEGIESNPPASNELPPLAYAECVSHRRQWDCKSFGVTPDHGRCIDDQ